MGEMEIQSVTVAGWIATDPIGVNEEVFFKIRSGELFPCVAVGNKATSIENYCKQGDEVVLQGKLAWRHFKQGPMLLIEVHYVSFGRKGQTLRV